MEPTKKDIPGNQNQYENATVLVVDDEAFSRRFFETILKDIPYRCATAENLSQCRDYLAHHEEPDLIILDVRLPDGNGLEFIQWLKNNNIMSPVIIITAYGTIEEAVDAIKNGAFDFFTKPFEAVDKLKIAINRAIQHGWLEKENRMLRTQLHSRDIFQNIIGKSKKMRRVYDFIQKAAKTESSVLVQGASGTGKELVAKAIHNLSSQKNKTFIPVNCAALPENLLESALFGYQKGAFTGANQTTPGFFEEANEGTLFLDEIGEAPLSVQAKILRAVEEGEIYRVGRVKPIPINVRLIFATNKELEAEVARGQFRKDLYYRINVIRITLPMLDERKEDIPLLAKHFIDEYCVNEGIRDKVISNDALSYLVNRSWPGNVRELKNFLHRVIILHAGAVIGADEMRQYSDVNVPAEDDSFYTMEFRAAKEVFEKKYFEKLLERSGNDINLCATVSGVHMATIYRKLNSMGIKIK